MKAYKLPLLLFILLSSLHAKGFENVYKIGDFKIFYTFNGKNKLPIKNQVDNNHNFVPDYIEYIGNQLNESSKLFSSLNYISPLESERYKNRAYFINVSIVKLKNNGSAYDGINKAKKNNIEKSKPALAMKISNKLSKNSLTPIHEYFHLLQNGYTMFKNRWYTEGTARWSETMLRDGIGKSKLLPQTNRELRTILSQTYKTSTMWNRLTYLIDENDCHPNRQNNYRICGTTFMKNFLENLMKYDKLASKEMHYKIYDWKEADQKSSKNNKYILMALANTVEKTKTNNNEVKSFLKLIKNFN